MKKIPQYLIISALACMTFGCTDKKPSSNATPTIVTQDNFPQAFTNMRLGAMVQKTGGVNKFFAMPVPSSNPDEQFVVRMNRDTPYSVSVIDVSSDNFYLFVLIGKYARLAYLSPLFLEITVCLT